MSSRRAFLLQSAAASIVAAAGFRTATAAAPGTAKHPMKMVKVPQTNLMVSGIASGCAGLVSWGSEPISGVDVSKATTIINTALDNGITLFDHADIYAGRTAETAFGQVLKQSPGLREKITVQPKC